MHGICFLHWAVCASLCVPMCAKKNTVVWCGTRRATPAIEILGFTVVCAVHVFPDAQHPVSVVWFVLRGQSQ